MQFYHGDCDPQKEYFPRDPIRCAVGYFDPNHIQPIRFKKADDSLYMQFDEDADGFGTVPQFAFYGTMTHRKGKNILWYPDRKFFLLGKDIL